MLLLPSVLIQMTACLLAHYKTLSDEKEKKSV
jgi:hypothetical protein